MYVRRFFTYRESHVSVGRVESGEDGGEREIVREGRGMNARRFFTNRESLVSAVRVDCEDIKGESGGNRERKREVGGDREIGVLVCIYGRG